MSKPVIAYWNIRGLAEPIRILLTYCGIDFEDKRYECGDAPEYSRECWNSVKQSIGLNFPNLPYYIHSDGKIKITQSNAILRFVATKYGLIGKTEEEQAKVMELENVAMDFRNAMCRLFYTNDSAFEEAKKTYLTNYLPPTLEKFENLLRNAPWFGGENLSFVDFVLYELLDQNRRLDEKAFADKPLLLAFLEKVENLDQIKKYLSSDVHQKTPINNKMASFK